MTSTQEFNCILCKDSFENKEELQIHFRKHGDPKFNESVKNSNNRIFESQKSNEKSQEKADAVTCDVCSDTFPTISKAITHKHKVHPDHDAKHFCPWCGKLFTMKHLYTKHIQTNHESKEGSNEAGYHCDYCEVDFFVPSAMVYHNKFFHRQDTELAVIGHSKKLKRLDEELLQIYYCPFCGDEYINKVNLHRHMGDDHSHEDQSPDDVLRCPLCEAIFYHLDAYELHLTFHSSEDLYGDDNNMETNITEFSLETMPPIMEKVENEPHEDAETTMNSIGIENFLQQAMNESVDNDNSNSEQIPEKKSKKHKKHKKSKKKEAITLDEFFNMNKDVFGEGIDFQGVEELPTQVVKKQLKGKKSLPKLKRGNKIIATTEIEKLKKQGIVVKMKSGKSPIQFPHKVAKVKPVGRPYNVAKNSIQNKTKLDTPMKLNAISTSSEVLSKLLNQSNSQIKIVKKTAQDDASSEQKNDESNSSLDKQNTSPTQSDTNHENEGEQTESKTEMEKNEMQTKISDNDRNLSCEITKLAEVSDIGNNATHNASVLSKCSPKSDVRNSESHENGFLKSEFFNEDSQNKSSEKCNDDINIFKENIKLNKVNPSVTKSMNALRNINQHITIKSVSTPNSVVKQQKTYSDEEAGGSENSYGDDEAVEVERSKDQVEIVKSIAEQNTKNNSLDAIKHLSHLITVKSVNQSKNITPSIAKKSETTENKTDCQKEFQNENPRECVEKLDISKPNLKEVVNEEKTHDRNETLKSCNTLKNLSKHITIKSFPQSSISKNITNDKSDEKDRANYDGSDGVDEDAVVDQIKSQPNRPAAVKNISNLKSSQLHISKQNLKEATLAVNEEKPHYKNESSKSCNALKNLSKHITIKSFPQLTTSKNFSDDESDENYHVSDDGSDYVDEDAVINHNKSQSYPAAVKNISNLKSQQTQLQSANLSPKRLNAPLFGKEICKREPTDEHIGQQSCTKILKQFPNLVAKPSNVLSKLNIKSSTQSMNVIMQGSSINKSIQKEERKEEIEIFNIDDSDDEVDSQDSSENLTSNKSIISSPKIDDYKFAANKSIQALKNLTKHITVKPSNPQKLLINKKILNPDELTGDENYSTHEEITNDADVPTRRNTEKPLTQQSMELQNKLKNLSRQITVKSRTSSPNASLKSFSKQDCNDNVDSDSNSSASKVKITEINEDYMSGDEIVSKPKLKANIGQLSKNVIIKSPDKSDSDNEVYADNSDYESDININKQPINLNSNSLSSLKNISKNITIKSFKDDKLDEEYELENSDAVRVIQGEKTKIPNLSNELSIKPLKQTKSICQIDNEVNKNAKQVIGRTSVQSSMNQNVATSSDQVNSVNKEVTVQTFQTKTVIQEVTTTVTKTIRTVNQTVKQEVRNTSQNFSNSMIRPQKIQGVMPNQQIKNFQGIAVRQATPQMGPRIRNPTAPARPAINTTVRPTNQLVPVRSGLNIIRPNNPRMLTPNKPTPSRPQTPVIGKALKISPNAIMPSVKRPAQVSSETLTGHFSCFKKPKESLIPVSDVPTFDRKQEGESTVHFTSSAQMSRSNFTSTTKTVKANSVVTSSQMKSEVCSEQLNRLGNMSGLKVVKTSQAKQASQVETKCEVSASKRTTLDAIERLQKQGLLVKKPRLEEDSHVSEHSNSDGENDYDT